MVRDKGGGGDLLGFDAQRLIALQGMKIAAGGSSARSAFFGAQRSR